MDLNKLEGLDYYWVAMFVFYFVASPMLALFVGLPSTTFSKVVLFIGSALTLVMLAFTLYKISSDDERKRLATILHEIYMVRPTWFEFTLAALGGSTIYISDIGLKSTPGSTFLFVAMLWGSTIIILALKWWMDAIQSRGCNVCMCSREG